MRQLPIIEVHQQDDLCVRRVPIFNALDGDQQRAVASLAEPVFLAKGEMLHAAGDQVARLFVVHTGRIKLVRSSASGRERLLRVAEPGVVVGEHAFLTGEPPEYFAEAATDARVCVFTHSDLDTLVATYPRIALEMMRSLSDRLTGAEHLLSLERADVGARLADYLLGLPEQGPAGERYVELPLAKKDIASYLGTTPESLSRALARLQGAGAIEVSGEQIRILSFDSLEALALEA